MLLNSDMESIDSELLHEILDLHVIYDASLPFFEELDLL